MLPTSNGMKRAALFALVLFLLFVFAVATAPFLVQAPRFLSGVTDPAREMLVVSVDGEPLSVMISRTPTERERGLGGRDSLEPAEGMLFFFDSDGRYAIWMKDMRFAIDVFWISADGRVVDMRSNISPDSYPEIFEPKVSARYILETPAGFAQKNGVRIGSIVSW